jgi:formamidopyrimidine-DNA glycosylase
MPELPEVETVCSGLRPLIVGQTIVRFDVRIDKLRWPVPPELRLVLPGQTIRTVSRRAKYILIEVDTGTMLIHLGMSGVVQLLQAETPLQKHDHIDLVFSNGNCLRMNDPRRFGAWLWSDGPVADHPRICHLGPEPLSENFNAAILHEQSHSRRVAVKNFIMDQKVVVGVGNIYASEALFRAGIDPIRPAGQISLSRYRKLVIEIKKVLAEAIEQGGTTIRDFTSAEGSPGYFAQRLMVYGREDQPCVACKEPIRNQRIGGRSSFYCPKCQT